MPWRKLTLEELDAKLKALGFAGLAELRRRGVTDEEIGQILTGENLPEPKPGPKSNGD
jgi:hypothetical protein